MAAAPALTVVIPTFNRQQRLHRVLTSLAGQTARGQFDVVVVSDGSTDGTDEYLASGDTPLPVTAVTQPNAGPAAARNRGVLAATGDIVLFIDDDVVPADDLVQRHLDGHRDDDEVVVIGPMLNPPDAQLSAWVEWEQHQLYKQYAAMQRGDWACTFRQFYTGNASAPRQRVIDVGLFDPQFLRAEDVELAFRLHETGVRFVFDPEAKGFHYAERSFESWLKTPFAYGRNDVAFMRSGQRWIPDTLPGEFRRRHVLVQHALATFCIRHRKPAHAITAALQAVGTGPGLLGPVRRQALSALYNVTYYQGLADALGSADAFLAMMAGRDSRRPRIAFVLEQTLGHITHSDNLRSLLAEHSEIEPVFLDVPFDIAGAAARVPGLSNWTVRAGLRARRAIRKQWRSARIDAMFIHTQVPAVLTGRWMKKIPTIVSLDATPEQYDQLGEFYAHDRSSPRVEALKKRANIRCFQRARGLVTWSEWARGSLIADYGVDGDRVTVIPPGVNVERWLPDPADSSGDPGTVRVLFVGGDLERKGGHLLLEAAKRLRDADDVGAFELQLVTRSAVEPTSGVVVHNAMAPNSPELIALYHESQIFCLPTLGDCLPMVLSEAGAAGMALISTDVGAIHEIVRDDETGVLVEPGDVDSLTAALARLIGDAGLRAKLGAAAQALVTSDFDAHTNADRLVRLLLDIVPRAGHA